jgi:cytochrome bd-type quinol oxidase subunit 1
MITISLGAIAILLFAAWYSYKTDDSTFMGICLAAALVYLLIIGITFL